MGNALGDIVIATPAGERRVEASALPIRIGSGPTADIRVPGPVTGEIAALVGVLDARAFLQPTGASAQSTRASVQLTINDAPVAATRWLADGDVVGVGPLRIDCRLGDGALRLEVTYADSGYATLPPAAAAAATEAVPIAPTRVRAADQPRRARLPRAGLVYVALALLALAALHLFTAKSVQVETVPATASIAVSGWLPLGADGRYLLRTGSYRVQVSAPGYERQTSDIVVDDAAIQVFRYELKKLPGVLALTIAPAAAAALVETGAIEVSIDERPVTADAEGRYRAAAGSRRLLVKAKRYQDFATTLEVEGREQVQSIDVKLVPNWADVSVTTEPAGAAIAVIDQADGEDGAELLGTTPAVVPVVAGSVVLELRKDGYKPARRSLTAAAGEPQELPLVKLEETDGLLTVVSAPAGAAVTIDGRYRGTTPLEAEIAPERAHTVIVAKPGYETATRAVTVERRGSARLSLELAQRIGIVRIASEPADAELLIDGVARGAATQELSLPATPQKLEVRKPGYASYVAEITPKPGFPQLLEVKLLTPEQAALAAIPQTVTTKQGLALRLIGPGAFEMGAPRREQGRRPNETQRAVRITRSFYIGTREITNREFREFRPQHTSGADVFQELAGPEHPVVMLSWEDAATFCNWLSERDGLPPAYALKDGDYRVAEPRTRGYRLPSEAEWEWAGRYNAGAGTTRYPWGESMPPTPRSGNYGDKSARGLVANVLAQYDDSFPATAPVASFAATALGLYDIGGNVAEWTGDFYSVYAGGPTGTAVDPLGAATGEYHVIRGAGWRHASISELRLAFRDFGDQGRLDVGFRIARDAGP